MLESILGLGLFGAFLLMIIGIIVLIGGGEVLIRGASRLAIALKIPPLIVGLTIVAFCTSAPELAVSLNAAVSGKADMAIGNVVGSSICNICLILGISAVIRSITVSSVLILREIPLMIFLSFLMYAFALSGGDGFFSLFEGDYEGMITCSEGLIFLGILVAYICWTVYEVSKHKKQNEEYIREIEEGVVSLEHEGGKIIGKGNLIVNVCYLIIGIATLCAGSEMLVKGGVSMARTFGVSELVIGLTILAVGTSLPELVVSVLAAVQGKAELAVGNVVGSNIFNILGVLGLTAVFSSDGIDVAAKALQFDIPFMLLISLFCIVICITGKRISRGEGVFLLVCYATYLCFICFSESGA